jgi:hypothetical protein
MSSLTASLIFAMSLGVLPAEATAHSAVPAPVQGQPRSRPAAAAQPNGTTKAPPAKARTSPKSATSAKAPASKLAGKPPGTKSAANKATPPAKDADCDSPKVKVAATKPVPVAADPLAPTLAPCAEPARKP